MWAVLLVGACGAVLVHYGMRFWALFDERAELQRLTLERAARNVEVSSAVGKPMELESAGEELTVMRKPEPYAEFVFPIAGPKGKGNLHGTAEKRDGKWSFSTLTAEIPGRAPPVDVLRSP